MKGYEKWSRSLTSAQYVSGLRRIAPHVTDAYRRVLSAHYLYERRSATATELAKAADVANHQAVIACYVTLARHFCAATGEQPDVRHPDEGGKGPRWWAIWADGWREERGYVWRMLPNLANALEEMGWTDSSSPFLYSGELQETGPLTEGATRRISVNTYERNRSARRRCLQIHGTRCVICRFDFGAVYGACAEGYIHVHHVRALSTIGHAYEVDPETDLVPVCPNCHAVLHMQDPPRSLDEMRALLTDRRNRRRRLPGDEDD